MKSSPCFVIYLCFYFFLLDFLYAQQDYAGQNQQECSLASPSTLGYKYNGPASCTSYLIYRPHAPYETDQQIESLLNASRCTTTIGDLRLPIFRFACSHSGDYYQHNATYVVEYGDFYYTIAKDQYQGLTACKALIDQNPTHKPAQLVPGTKLVVPLRCACPTEEQKNKGIKHLITYPIVTGDCVADIAKMFNVSASSILHANKLQEKDYIYPQTTILLPIKEYIGAEIASM